MTTDPLTIAYIAIGVHNALILSGQRDLPPSFCGGQLEFVDAIIDYADLLDWRASELKYDVFVYDIAQPFGEAFAAKWIASDVKPDAEALIKELFKGGS